jgi:hypothetical protein
LANSGKGSFLDEYSLGFIARSFTPPDGIEAYNFTAIDNQSRILAVDEFGGQSYMLVPTPEPASLLLLVTGLIFCAVLLRSRTRRPTAKSAIRPGT